ncbi:MAG: hypothetical protein IKB70_08820 [Bacilli bacterium]|nr:hypothetical protein [Bacilli bacterium]
MRNRVVIIYVSFAVLLISVGLIILSSCFSWVITINIGYGIFGSSFVTLFIYVFEYFVEKKKSFELFYIKCIEILNSVKKIKYFDFNEQNDALMMYSLFENQMGNKDTLVAFYKEMIDKCHKHNPDFSMPQKDFKQLSNAAVEHFKECAKTYLEFMDSDFMELGLIIGDNKYLIPFLARNQNKLRRNTYEYIMMLCKEVNQNSGVIYSFVTGGPAKISYKILKNNYRHLNDIFFDKKIENNKKVVYAKACDDLFDMIEIMRASFYRKKYVKKDRYPAFEELNSH